MVNPQFTETRSRIRRASETWRIHEPRVKPAPARIRERLEGAAMPVRQKTFRIEHMSAGGDPRSVAPDRVVPSTVASGGAGSALQHHDVLTELKALRALI